MMAGAPPPDVALVEGGLAVVNSEAVVTRTETVLKAAFGSKNVQRAPPITASEDFSAFVNEGVPSMFFFVGVSDPQQVAESMKPGGKPCPSTTHRSSPRFPSPRSRQACRAMSLTVLNVLMPR
jgi:hippurate hydrolase